jgi:hypothetical protein
MGWARSSPQRKAGKVLLLDHCKLLVLARGVEGYHRLAGAITEDVDARLLVAGGRQEAFARAPRGRR